MVTTVCAQCGSRLRPEDSWCSLCLAPRPGAERAPAPAPTRAPAPARGPAPVRAAAPTRAPAVAGDAIPRPRDRAAEPVKQPVKQQPAEPEPVEDGVVAAEPAFELPGDWEDGVVVTGARQTVERQAQAAASAERLIAELAASERATRSSTRLGRLPYEVADRTGLAPSQATLLLGAAGGVALLLVLMVALTVLGLFL